MSYSFQVLEADPPWPFGDKLPGPSRGAEKNYRVMSVADICAFPLPAMDDNSVLFLWRVAAMQEEALRVMRAWGYTPKTEIVWRKLTKNGLVHFGMGRYTRASHETCLVGVKGRCLPRARNVRSVFDARVGEHSQKPAEFYSLVEQLYGGPYARLFARSERPGWSSFGGELP